MALLHAMTLPRQAATPRTAVDFTAVVREHEDEVFGVALRILGDRDAASEAAHVTFLKAYRGWDRYDAGRPLRHWLLGIAANEAISAGRRRTRERARTAGAEEAVALADAGPAPEEAALAREERDRVRGAVAALPELYRAPIVLRYFSGLSVEEVAAVLRRSASTVGVQLLRGRALLRASLTGVEVSA